MTYYAGVDLGLDGAIAYIGHGQLTVWDMPCDGGGKNRTINIAEIAEIVKTWPCGVVGVEWPHCWPGTFGDVVGHAEKFGYQKGVFATLLREHGFTKIEPTVWCSKLGLPGKLDPDAIPMRANYLEAHYPDIHDAIRGPRGGLKDGRIDAFCIAHYMKITESIPNVVKQYGKGSPQAMAAVLGWGNKKNRRLNIRDNTR